MGYGVVGVARGGPGTWLSPVLCPRAPHGHVPTPGPPHALLVFIALLTIVLGLELVPVKPQPGSSRPCPGAKSSWGDAKNTPTLSTWQQFLPILLFCLSLSRTMSLSLHHRVAGQGVCHGHGVSAMGMGCLPWAQGVCHGHGHPVPGPTLTMLTANPPCLRVLFFYL